jgi:hypothetical protein
MMAVVGSKEMYRGRSRQTQYGDVPVYVRIFLVTVNDANTDLQEISEEPGVAWLDTHPENENALLVESSVQQDGDSPFHYKVTLTYKSGEDLLENPTDRPPQFSFSGSLASAPCFWHYPNANSNVTKQIIINTAGDAIGGLDRDEGEFSVTITMNVDPPFDYQKAQRYVGAINSDTWSGGVAGTWKCQSISGNRKIEEVAGEKYVYWEVNSTLAYRSTGWDLLTWDVGFNEVINGERIPIKAGNERISEPAALTNGRKKTPGQPPDMLRFRIYPAYAFVNSFPQLPT